MFLNSFPFKLMSIVGGWQPKTGSLNKYLKVFYPIYSIFVIFSLYTYTITQIIRMTKTNGNVNEFNEILFTMLSSMLVSIKATFYVFRQNKVRALGNQLLNPTFFPRNSEEKNLKNKFEKINR